MLQTLISMKVITFFGTCDVCAAFTVLHTYAVCPFGGRRLKFVALEKFPIGAFTRFGRRVCSARACKSSRS